MNAADPNSIEKAKDRRRRDSITRETILRTMMNSREGRRFIYLELERAHVFGMSLALDGDNAFARTAFLEGERNIGNQLLAEVTSSYPKEYVLLLQENSSKEKPDDRDDPVSD